MISEHVFKMIVATDYKTGTTVAILKDISGRELGSGSAKLHPNDAFDPLIGADIAQYRAMLEYFGGNVSPDLR